jgi:hypothetical protein
LIDIVRARLGSVKPTIDLILFLIDQAVHLLTIAAALSWSGWLQPRPAETVWGLWLQSDHHLTIVAGYVLLTMPAWVLVHFVVRGMGAESTSLPGRPGEKYLGMIERALIATFVLLGQFILVPLVVVPRLALDGYGGNLTRERLGYLNELLMSVSLALAVAVSARVGVTVQLVDEGTCPQVGVEEPRWEVNDGGHEKESAAPCRKERSVVQ